MSDINAIIKRFMCFDDNACSAEACYKNVFTEDVMIIRLSYSEDGGDGENVIIIISCDDVISASYSYIKFITLFKYLTLYHISYFES